MKKWSIVLLGSLSMYLLLSCAGIKVYSEGSEAEVKENPGKEKVLATVNGVPIYQKDIFGIGGMPPAAFQQGQGGKDFSQDILKRAIDQELLYQEAKSLELDKDPEYQEQLNRMKQYEKQYETQRLANLLETKRMSESREKSNYTPSQEEIDNYYEANKDRFSKIAEDQAKSRISQILISQKAGEEYQKWLKEVFAKATIKVNGNPISKETLSASIESDLLSTPMFGAPMAPRTEKPSNVFFETVKQMIIEQSAKEKEAEKSEIEKDQAKVKELFLSAKMSINDKTVLLGDYPQLQTLFVQNPQGPPVPMYYPALLMIVKEELLAQQAKAEKLDQGAAFPGSPYPVMGGLNQERMMLIRRLEEKSGFYSQPASITDEEINQYYEENKARWEKMGFEKAKMRIRNILISQKAQEKREGFLGNLRAKADIKIMEQEVPETKE